MTDEGLQQIGRNGDEWTIESLDLGKVVLGHRRHLKLRSLADDVDLITFISLNFDLRLRQHPDNLKELFSGNADRSLLLDLSLTPGGDRNVQIGPLNR